VFFGPPFGEIVTTLNNAVNCESHARTHTQQNDQHTHTPQYGRTTTTHQQTTTRTQTYHTYEEKKMHNTYITKGCGSEAFEVRGV
jgi:hypothetical protein